MKIDSKVFEGLVADVMPAIQARTTLPILECVHVYSAGARLVVEATNLELGIRSETWDVVIDDPIAFCVSAKRLHRILKVINGELTIEHDGGMLSIRDGSSEFDLATLDPDDYPPLPEVDDENVVTFGDSKLQDALRAVAYAISHDEHRYILNGVSIEFAGDHVDVVATDGRRLAHVGIDSKCGEFNALDGQKLILAENAVRSIGQNSNENLSLFCASNDVCVKSGDLTVFAKAIEGQFPNWRQVARRPDESVGVKFSVSDAITAIRRVSIMADDIAPNMVVRFKDNECHLSARGEYSGSANDSFKCEFEGDHVFSVNPAYMADAIKSCGSDDIVIFLNANEASDSAILFTAGNYEAVLMPMRYTAEYARPVGDTNGKVAAQIDADEEASDE